ncbi:MAG TPA: hypothetical protein VGC99_28810 [Candidatus Tectomicrobia bacterium]
MRDVKQGLSLAQHAQLGNTLRAIRGELLAVRQLVAAGESSGSHEYAAVSKLLRELKTLETVLRLAAVGQHVDTRPLGELQRLYGDDHGEGA